MDGVRARFQPHIDHGALKPPKFRGGIGHHIDFLNGVSGQERQFVGAGGRTDQGSGVDKDIEVLHTIQHPIIALDTGAVG